MELQPIKKGKGIVYAFGDQVYRIKSHRPTKEEVYFQCVEKTCPGSIVTNSDKIFLRRVSEHQHPQRNLEIRKNKFLEALKDRCVNETTPLKVIFDQEIARENIAVTVDFQYPVICPKMRQWRRKTFPKKPTSIQELGDMLSEGGQYVSWGRSIEGTQPLFRGMVGNPPHALIFMSEELKSLLIQENAFIHIDGTFKAVPDIDGVYQTLTVMATYQDKSIPVFWAVMTSKLRAHYVDVFQQLKNLVPEMNPAYVCTDFESGLIRAIRECFPNARLIGCHFHFVQILRRRRHIDGLTDTLLQENEYLRIFFEMCKVLVFLPAEHFEAGMKVLEQYAKTPGTNTIILPARKFLAYLRRTWLRRSSVASVFRAPKRTNNEIEAYHRYIILHMNITTRGGHRPNAFNFLRAIQYMENAGRHRHLGIALAVRGTKWKVKPSQANHDAQVRQCMQDYENPTRNVEQIKLFLGRMKHHAPTDLVREQLNPSSEDLNFDEVVSYELEAIFDDPDVDDSTSQIIGANGENNDEESHEQDAVVEIEMDISIDDGNDDDDDGSQNVATQANPIEAELNGQSGPSTSTTTHMSILAAGECFVCYNEQKEFLVSPCGHWGVCNSCRQELENLEPIRSLRRCPFCREYDAVFLKPRDV